MVLVRRAQTPFTRIQKGIVDMCPPGMFCWNADKIIWGLLIVLAIAIVWILWHSMFPIVRITAPVPTSAPAPAPAPAPDKHKIVVINRSQPLPPTHPYGQDTMSNPYMPPERLPNDFLPRGPLVPRGAVPVNIRTNPYSEVYQQVGILTKIPQGDTGEEPLILPLFGRRTDTSNDRWNYYTQTDGFHPVKIPVQNRGRACSGNNGCDEIYSGDTVYLDSHKANFQATIYEINEPRYIPVL